MSVYGKIEWKMISQLKILRPPHPHPKGIELTGKTVRLEPLDALKHAEDLFQANSFDRDGVNWQYLPYGPFAEIEDYANWLQENANKDVSFFFSPS